MSSSPAGCRRSSLMLYLDGGDSLLDEPLARRAALLMVSSGREPRYGSSPEADVAARSPERYRSHRRGDGEEDRRTCSGGRRGAPGSGQAAHLDLAILAAEWGSGRRRGTLSNLHLGARQEQGGGFVMLGKTFKGLTDEMLAWQTTRLLALETGRDDYTVYVRPELVAEIAFNDVQVSPQYPGGLALRFARVKRYRTDKTADEADTFAAVQRIHQQATSRT